MAASPAFGKQVRAAGAEQQLPCTAPAAQADLCPAGQKPHGLSGQQMRAVVGSVLSAPAPELKNGKTHSTKSCPKDKLTEPKRPVSRER